MLFLRKKKVKVLGKIDLPQRVIGRIETKRADLQGRRKAGAGIKVQVDTITVASENDYYV